MTWIFGKTGSVCSAIFALLLLVSNSANASSPFAIRTIPEKLTTWQQIRDYVSGDLPKGNSVKVREQGDSLVIQEGDNQYQLMLHKGDVIQFSTLAQKETGSFEPMQYGRSPSRAIKDYLRHSPDLKRTHDYITKFFGIKILEEQTTAITGTRDFRSALVIPEDGSTPYIQLSNKYAKHPVFGAAHEMQHVLNQALLPQIVDTQFAREAPAIRPALRSYMDEFLAVSFELKTYRELVAKFPHLANQELNELASLSEGQIRQYVFQKWKSYYHWPDSIMRVIISGDFQGEELLKKIHAFQNKYGRKADLSPGEKRQIYFDQKKNPKIVDEQVIAAPKNSHLPWLYRPEAGASFPIRTVWLPAEALNIAQLDSQLPLKLMKTLTREENGEKYYAFFVHPLSEERFQGLIEKFESTWNFVATPSSSNRTLLIRSFNGPEKFYVKTSLAAEIAGIERTVPSKEVSRSVGHSLILAEVAKDEKNLLFLPEPLAIIPKGMERGGQVVRLLKAQMPTKNLVPLFSFYDMSDGSDLTGKLARGQGISRYEFLKEQLVKPLLAELENLRDRHALVHEAHAQNILVETDDVGRPTGRFVFKDLAGISADLSKYPEIKGRLPHFGELSLEYYQQNLKQSFKQSFDSYFKSGFLYGVDQYLARVEPQSKKKSPLSGIMELGFKDSGACSGMFEKVGNAAKLRVQTK